MENTRNTQLDQMLDDCYNEVVIGGLTFSPSDIVFNLDPIAYRCMVTDGGYEDDLSDEDNANE